MVGVHRRFWSRWAPLVVVGACWLACGRSEAQSETDKVRPARAMMQGDEQFRSQIYEAAIESYRKADAIMGVPTTRFALARALEKLGELVQARAVADSILYGCLAWCSRTRPRVARCHASGTSFGRHWGFLRPGPYVRRSASFKWARAASLGSQPLSRCELQIELESETVQPGQPVRGAIRGLVDQECSCSGLEVGFVLVGAGTRCNDHSEAMTVFRGSWTPGEHRYPFELKAPSHPLEYIGKTVCYSWEVEARARIPWGDAVASTPVRLVAPAGMGLRVTMDSPGDPANVVSDEPPPRASDPKGYAIAALLALGAVGAIVAGFLLGAWEPVAAGAVFLVIVPVALVAHAKGRPAENAAARRRVLFGRPQLAAYQKDGPGVPGSQQASQGLECTVWLKPDAPPADVKVSLLVVEITRVQGEKNDIEHIEYVYSDTRVLSSAEPGCYRGWLPIPEVPQVPTTFGLGKKSTKWGLYAAMEAAEEGWSHSIERRLYAVPAMRT